MRSFWHGLLLASWFTACYGQTIDAYTTESPPFQSARLGLPGGYAVDVAKELARQNGDKLVFHFLPWARSYQLARQTPGVLLFSLSEIDAHAGNFAWVGAIASNNVALWQLKSRRDLQLKTLDDARHRQIGVLRDDFKTRYLLLRGFQEGSELQYGSDDLLNLRKLLAGRLDLLPANNSDVLIHLARSNGLNPQMLRQALPLPELASPLGIAFSPGSDRKLVSRYALTLEKLRQQGFLAQQQRLLQLTLSSAQKAD
ncbi:MULTISPECIES: ABC transporter substrate-binding protein [unclassified Paludibacterium]|uniref:substrate-binding periplasmic protein n=1 Tax=unclassified Paludibacterium TaxID=2618429 RepID=UPI001C043CCF|nr:ABC transporter substrate-binding protein [Paludibacterium sp. B53371]BEV71969.1 transporter substrate-binding domain-containing protein [Paludibacterium sp. THUN1379]